MSLAHYKTQAPPVDPCEGLAIMAAQLRQAGRADTPHTSWSRRLSEPLVLAACLKPNIRWTKSVFTNHTLAFTGSRASASDAAGAAYFGFEVVWINRLGQKAERLCGRADAELNSLWG